LRSRFEKKVSKLQGFKVSKSGEQSERGNAELEI
jgi:hypothetical protein